MAFEAARAEAYYQASLPLIGMVDRKSRGSLWALIEIYHRLLHRIVASNYAVFGQRQRVSAPAKLTIVLRGFLR